MYMHEGVGGCDQGYGYTIESDQGYGYTIESDQGAMATL